MGRLSHSSIRRAEIRLLALAVALLLLAWLAPGARSAAARSNRDMAAAAGDSSACGDNWSAAKLIATLPGNLTEVSGFVSSARYPGVAWMIRDSQNPDSLYSFELDAGDEPHWKEFPISGGTANQ